MYASFRDESNHILDQVAEPSTATARPGSRLDMMLCQAWRRHVVFQLLKLNTRPAMTEALKSVGVFLSSATTSIDPGYRTVELFRPLICMRLGLDEMAHDLTRRLLSRDVPQANANDSLGRIFQNIEHLMAALVEKRDQLRTEDQATNVFEKLAFIPELTFETLSEDFMNYAHLILHKVKALICIQSMDHVDLVAHILPPELLCRVQCFMTTTTMTNCAQFKSQVITGKCLNAWKISLKSDIEMLFDIVDGRCAWFWPLVSNTSYLWSPMITEDETMLQTFGLVCAIFRETPGALEWIRAYIQERITAEEITRREDEIVQRNMASVEAYEKANARGGDDGEEDNEEEDVEAEEEDATSEDDEADEEVSNEENEDGEEDQE